MIQITRRERFNAAHRLYNPKWSPEKNWEVFGLCSQVHGHNWELFVTLEGEIDPDTGYVMDLKKLRDILEEEIISKVDHSYMNETVPFLDGILPTTENVAIAFWNILEEKLKSVTKAKLYKIKLTETENHFVEYFGKK